MRFIPHLKIDVLSVAVLASLFATGSIAPALAQADAKAADAKAADAKPADAKPADAKAPEVKADTGTETKPANTSPAKQPTDLKTLAAICPSIRARIDKDHRVRLSEEVYRGEKRVHVYLYLSEQQLPYLISLGWFAMRNDAERAAPPPEKKKNGLVGTLIKKPISISLGKTKELLNPITDRNRSLIAVDELGLVLPDFGSEPRDKNYDKAAWNAVLGFDKLGSSDPDDAEKDFNDALKISPINARFNNNLGALLAAKGDYSAATPHLDRAIRENDKFAAAYANRALLSLAIGQPQAAIEDATRALKLEPQLIVARVAYARALMETGQQSEALKMAQALKADAPAEWQSMLLLADALLANKEYRESKTTLARLSILSPNNPGLVLKLAHANEKIGDLDEAIKQARKATQIAPNDPATHIALARYLDANRDANGARLQFERALDLKPERSLRKSAMGAVLRILIATSKLPLADEASKKWVKQYPDDAECHYNRAWIASQLEGDHAQECIDEYRKALEQEPTLSSVHYNLALVLLKAGKNQEALKELRDFVSKSPDDSDCASAKELIKKLEGNG
jgi:tetratricopeptide (TPR) repeat protein